MLSNPQSGGLQGLLDTFKQKGLGEIVGSWVCTGKNLPVSPDQLQQVMGSGKIQEIAQSLGIDASKVSASLSKFCPRSSIS